jgi:hypothetical protein
MVTTFICTCIAKNDLDVAEPLACQTRKDGPFSPGFGWPAEEPAPSRYTRANTWRVGWAGEISKWATMLRSAQLRGGWARVKTGLSQIKLFASQKKGYAICLRKFGKTDFCLFLFVFLQSARACPFCFLATRRGVSDSIQKKTVRARGEIRTDLFELIWESILW